MAAAALALGLAGCARKAAAPTRDIRPVAEAYYRAHPGFFHFKTLADLPKNLVWHDGRGVPEFADPAAKRGGTLHASIPDFPVTLRFYGPDSGQTFRPFLLDDIAISLIQEQPNTGQYYPGLARQWAFDPDRRTMYFRLDPDARYSDGVPIRADDFLFAFFFFRCGDLHDPWSLNFYTTNYSQITKYDDLTFSVTWKEPKPDLEYLLGSLIPVPEHFYKDLGPDYPQYYQWRLEPTSGPYTIRPEDIHKGASIDLTRVPNWWATNKRFFRHRYNPDRIHFVVIRDPEKEFEAFKRGDIDVADVTSVKRWYEQLPDSDPLVRRGAVAKVTFYNQIPRPTVGFDLNCSDPLLSNRDIRRGIAYASNFDLVDREYFRGDRVRMQTSADGYPAVPFPGIHPRPFSVKDALACFAKAGFTRRGPDGILVDGQGRRLSVTVTCPYETMRDPLTILRQEAAKAGLELKIEILDMATAFKKIDEKHDQIAFCAFSLPVELYPRYWEAFDSANANRPNTNNVTNTDDPVMDRLISRYDRAQTMDEIRALARKLELRIRYDAAFIPGFEAPFYREAHWRWIKYPPTFATRESNGVVGGQTLDFGLFWIDNSVRAAVLAAAHGGPPLPPDIKVYDQWKTR
ncbi:MAG: extracellular solute-binding protein [Opitutaceae bacterium]